MYIIGDNGEVSTYPDRDKATGRMVEMPMTHAAAGTRPPCGACPKLEGVEDKKPLAPDADLFADWFWAVRALWREWRAVGPFFTPDPLMRACFAEMHAADERVKERATSSGLAAAVVRLLRGR